MNQPVPTELPGPELLTKSTQGGTNGSRCICSRGWPCWTSKGGEVLGPEKAQCPRIGECQNRGVSELASWHREEIG